MSRVKETPEKKLDIVLESLNNDEEYRETHQEISKKFTPKLSDKDLHLILEKLLKDEYISNSFTKSGGIPTDEKTFYISYKGRLFLRRGGYQQESRNLKRKSRWIIAKTIAAILNAIAILTIGIISIAISKDSNIKDKQIFNLENTIDSLKVLKQSLIKFNDTTSNKIDTSNQNKRRTHNKSIATSGADTAQHQQLVR